MRVKAKLLDLNLAVAAAALALWRGHRRLTATGEPELTGSR